MQYRKKIRHFHEPGDLHEFTFSCYQRRPLLNDEDWMRRLGKHIDAAGTAERIDLVAFVYMPEHVHLLVYPRDQKPDLANYLALIKQPFSSEIKQILIDQESPLLDQLTIQARPGKTSFRFWQAGPGFDRNIHSKRFALNAIDYLHRNPVRRGLSLRAVDWKWSSARYYLCETQKQQYPELPMIQGLPLGYLD